ncbi:MAG: VOC family protein, partial [archaeon]|nr:VOC family protein [archaeon]
KSEKEVNEILSLAKQSGGRIIKRAQKASWGGYSGYFADPDGYLWEVVYNPFWKVDRNGSVIMK